MADDWARMRTAREHERDVAERIRALGHSVEPFGQELLSESIRGYLKETGSLLRWLPDMAVMVAASRIILLVDAKGCDKGNRNTSNHSIEMRSLMSGLMTDLPVWYVCHEFKALSLGAIVDDGPDRMCCEDCWSHCLGGDPSKLPVKCFEHQRRGGRGTGTPYVLVSKSRCLELDRVMPPVVGVVA